MKITNSIDDIKRFTMRIEYRICFKYISHSIQYFFIDNRNFNPTKEEILYEIKSTIFCEGLIGFENLVSYGHDRYVSDKAIQISKRLFPDLM